MRNSSPRLYTLSFLRGLGRALDLRGSVQAGYPRTHGDWRRSDAAALASDWQAVWGDLGHAYEQVKRGTAAAHG